MLAIATLQYIYMSCQWKFATILNLGICTVNNQGFERTQLEKFSYFSDSFSLVIASEKMFHFQLGE